MMVPNAVNKFNCYHYNCVYSTIEHMNLTLLAMKVWAYQKFYHNAIQIPCQPTAVNVLLWYHRLSKFNMLENTLA